MVGFAIVSLLLLGYWLYRVRATQWWRCLTGRHLWRARWEQYPSQYKGGPFYYSHTHMKAWCDECGHRTCLTLTGHGCAQPFGYRDDDGGWAPGFDPLDPAHVKDMGRAWGQADADDRHFEVRDGRGPH